MKYNERLNNLADIYVCIVITELPSKFGSVHLNIKREISRVRLEFWALLTYLSNSTRLRRSYGTCLLDIWFDWTQIIELPWVRFVKPHYLTDRYLVWRSTFEPGPASNLITYTIFVLHKCKLVNEGIASQTYLYMRNVITKEAAGIDAYFYRRNVMTKESTRTKAYFNRRNLITKESTSI